MTTPPRRAARLIAALGVLTGFAVVTAVLVVAGPHRSDLPHRPRNLGGWVSNDPEHALATLVGVAAWLCLLWLAAGVLIASLSRLPGATGRVAAVVSGRMLPTALRGALEITLGVTLAAGGAAPAFAAGPAPSGYPATAVAAAVAAAPAGAQADPGTPLTAAGWPDLGLPATGPSAHDPAAAGRPATPPATDRSAGRPPTAPAPVRGPSREPAVAGSPAGGGPTTPGVSPVAELTGGLGSSPTAATPGAPAGHAATTAPGPTTDTGTPSVGSPAAAVPGTPAPSAAGWPDLDLPSGGANGVAPVDDTAVPRAVPPSTPVAQRADPTVPPAAGGPAWPDLDLPVSPTTARPTTDSPAPASGGPTTGPTHAAARPTPVTPAPAVTSAPAAAPVSSPGPAASPTHPPGWPDLGGTSGDLITGSSGRGTGSPGVEEASEVVVHRGDSLWSIVARQLGPGATDEQVAAAWPAWWAANRDVIGPNPNLILPGQVLRPPAGP